jgi:hypothetical protein
MGVSRCELLERDANAEKSTAQMLRQSPPRRTSAHTAMCHDAVCIAALPWSKGTRGGRCGARRRVPPPLRQICLWNSENAISELTVNVTGLVERGNHDWSMRARMKCVHCVEETCGTATIRLPAATRLAGFAVLFPARFCLWRMGHFALISENGLPPTTLPRDRIDREHLADNRSAKSTGPSLRSHVMRRYFIG